MALKIKWNDDRVRAATTAILLIARDRLARGATENLIEASLALFRDDPDDYKRYKATWPDAKGTGSLTNPQHIAYYNNLRAAVDQLLKKFERAQRQFNSLRELDNCLVASLQDVR